MKLTLKSVLEQFKRDMVIYFEEPFMALPKLLLPGLFFFVYAGIMARSYENIECFTRYIPMYMILISFLTVFLNMGTQVILSTIHIFDVIYTYTFRGLLIAVLGFFQMIGVAVLFFRVPLSNHMILYFFSYIIIFMIMILLSLTIHGFFNSETQAMSFTILGFQYVLFASGMLMPVEKLPLVLKGIVYINPVYHMNLILSRVWCGSAQKFVNIMALLVCIIVCFVILKYQKRLPNDRP